MLSHFAATILIHNSQPTGAPYLTMRSVFDIAMQDEMLPPQQMRELYTIAKDAGAKDVTWVDFADAHHMGERNSSPICFRLPFVDPDSHAASALMCQ